MHKNTLFFLIFYHFSSAAIWLNVIIQVEEGISLLLF